MRKLLEDFGVDADLVEEAFAPNKSKHPQAKVRIFRTALIFGQSLIKPVVVIILTKLALTRIRSAKSTLTHSHAPKS